MNILTVKRLKDFIQDLPDDMVVTTWAEWESKYAHQLYLDPVVVETINNTKVLALLVPKHGEAEEIKQ